MQCSECGHEVPAGKDRCMYCGAVLEGMANVKEPMKQGEKVFVEEQTYSYATPEPEPDTSTDLEAGTIFKAPVDKFVQEVPRQFALEKTRRRTPLGRVTLVFIFFASAAFMGFILFLLS